LIAHYNNNINQPNRRRNKMQVGDEVTMVSMGKTIDGVVIGWRNDGQIIVRWFDGMITSGIESALRKK